LNEPVSSVDRQISDDNQRSILDLIADDEKFDPQSLLSQSDLKEHLLDWINQLDGRHREVLMRRFGIGEFDEKATLEDVGKAVGLTRERVRQLQMESLQELRKIMESNGLNTEILFGEQQ